ncbi:hypothetical protein ABC974_02885 [Sphingomonas oligophenolica]|uniref:Uncharacterized protein n=1 Tax=Sphingomonas oligophenolica TaxID=301154 RepID=A0ABU9XYD2_9SPHN
MSAQQRRHPEKLAAGPIALALSPLDHPGFDEGLQQAMNRARGKGCAFGKVLQAECLAAFGDEFQQGDEPRARTSLGI